MPLMQMWIDRFRAVMRNGRGLENPEHAVLAIALVIAVGGFVAAIAPSVSSTYSDLGHWIAGQARPL